MTAISGVIILISIQVLYDSIFRFREIFIWQNNN